MGGALTTHLICLLAAVDICGREKYHHCSLDVIVSEYGGGVSSRW